MDDCCRLVLPYNAVHSIQQTEQIPNDPPQMGAKSTTTSNHPSTPRLVITSKSTKLKMHASKDLDSEDDSGYIRLSSSSEDKYENEANENSSGGKSLIYVTFWHKCMVL